jgi:hypothetical protein
MVTPVANLPPVSTTLGKMVENFATGVIDTGGAPCDTVLLNRRACNIHYENSIQVL